MIIRESYDNLEKYYIYITGKIDKSDSNGRGLYNSILLDKDEAQSLFEKFMENAWDDLVYLINKNYHCSTDYSLNGFEWDRYKKIYTATYGLSLSGGDIIERQDLQKLFDTVLKYHSFENERRVYRSFGNDNGYIYTFIVRLVSVSDR